MPLYRCAYKTDMGTVMAAVTLQVPILGPHRGIMPTQCSREESSGNRLVDDNGRFNFQGRGPGMISSTVKCNKTVF